MSRADLTTHAWKTQAARIKARDGACVYCGAPDDLTVDHLEPYALNPGARSDDELVTLCRPCNSRKGARVLTRVEYRAPGWFA